MKEEQKNVNQLNVKIWFLKKQSVFINNYKKFMLH